MTAIVSTTLRRLLYLLSAAALAPLWFALLLGGWLAAGLTAATPLLVPALLAYRPLVAGGARVEASLARRLLGAEVRAAAPGFGRPGYWGRVGGILGDAVFWRAQAFLVLRTVMGGAFAIGAVCWLGSALWLAVLPLAYRAGSGEEVIWRIDSATRALPFVPVGILGILAFPVVVRLLAAPWPFLADGLLGGRRSISLRGALAVHAGLWAGVNVLLLAIWAGIGAHAFWPAWTILPWALPLAVHAWAVLVGDRPGLRRRLGGTALALETGAAASIELFLVAIWALTSRGAFWPVWPAIGLAIPLLAHATVVLAQSRGRAPLAERIGVLETTRAGAVDVAGEELRRIERDLHDGAQARLVALGMSLGLAEQKLATDPAAAAQLLAEARASTGAALRELRDLARGIHPPILADRGLAAALDALAGVTPIPVAVDVTLAERPPASVETAAYFVAAEALANAVKHAGATLVGVSIGRDGEALTVRVVDDGRGGADAAGNGLRGLRQRVEALDGALTVTSPSGGPTTVEAVLPCAS